MLERHVEQAKQRAHLHLADLENEASKYADLQRRVGRTSIDSSDVQYPEITFYRQEKAAGWW